MLLPTTKAEMRERGWDKCDVIIVTPDAYIDHPSFAMAILGRFLEHHGYRTGILSQPQWKEPASFLELGIPEIAFAVSGGNMDSMVLNYTASKKPRKEDLFCEGGYPWFSRPGEGKKYRIRPDRTTTVYTNQIRTASKHTPVIIGGIEASLRRIAHYDYWTDSVRRSLLFDAKADLLVYGMGEQSLLEAIRGLENNIDPSEMEIPGTVTIRPSTEEIDDPVILPSYQEVKTDKRAFREAFRLFYLNGDLKNLVQQQDTRYCVQFPQKYPDTETLDRMYDLPFTRLPHPKYTRIPAFEMIKDSVTSHRGCMGRCSFCAITAHQGARVISRSEESVLREVRAIASRPKFSGTITDIGGPSANMYASSCRIGGCEHPDCLGAGRPCPEYIPGISRYLALLDKADNINGVSHVFVSSGLRFDPVLMNEEILSGLLRSHIPGQMKIAPESGSNRVLGQMHKPEREVFSEFLALFRRCQKEGGKSRRIIPYIIIGHPGEGDDEWKETEDFLLKNHLSKDQSQIFTPTPLTLSTAMYYLGSNPLTGEEIKVEKDLRILEKRKKSATGGSFLLSGKKRGNVRN